MFVYSYHTWKVRVYFSRSLVVIHKYNHTLSTWLRTCCIFILLLSRKNRAQMKNLHDSCSPQQELARISNFLHSSTFGNRFGTVGPSHNQVDVWFRSKLGNFIANSSPSHVFLYQWICLQKLMLTSWKWVTNVIYDITIERTSLNTFLWNFQQKFTGEITTCIILYYFENLGRQKTEILLQNIVISWQLVGKAPYIIGNKLVLLTHKIFNTTFVSTYAYEI